MCLAEWVSNVDYTLAYSGQGRGYDVKLGGGVWKLKARRGGRPVGFLGKGQPAYPTHQLWGLCER